MSARWASRVAAFEYRVDSAIGRSLRRHRGWRATPLVSRSYGRAGADGWVRLLGRVLLLPADAATTTDGRSRGWRRYMTIAFAAHKVEVEVAGHRFETVSAAGGYLDERVAVNLSPGLHHLRVTTADGASGTGMVTVIDPGVTIQGVVSDVDDTVVVTLLPRPLVALWNMLVRRERARQAVPGMASFLTAASDGFVVYLSTGAWNYAPVIRDFLLRTGYPDGSLLMTDWGPSPEWEFHSVVEHKRTSLRRLHAEFPELTWILVGDDGQHDPAIYEEFAAEHPGAVDLIAIREVTTGDGTTAATDRGHLARARSPASLVRRVSGPDGHALLTALHD